MDVNTEYYLYKKFRELIAGRSALIISHRFSTVRMADKIYVLEDGAISESGSHRQLMERQGTYAEMYRKQAAWMEGAPCHPPRKKL
jgi:ATP-binding cassette subfamily B protein